MAEGPEWRRRFERLNIAFVGNYLPRQCGIATFTTDLCEAVAKESPVGDCFAVAINDRPEGYRYPSRVRFEVAQNRIDEYVNTADFLNVNQIDITCLQHEFGIYGGTAGAHILSFLQELRMPLVVTLHTVLQDPTEDQKRVFAELGRLADRLIVMSERSIEFLTEIYGISPEKVALIHHGIPDMPFVDPNYYKDQFGVEGRPVILTFGLLSPNKGIEHVIDAIPRIRKKFPDVVYIILGATHPHVKRLSGESYRLSLEQRVRNLGIQENVLFQNRFVDLKELAEFLGAADVYVTPYLTETQIVSGTLAYALGAGKAIVSTPYWYATEILAENRGRLAPFADPTALAEQINDYFEDETERHATRKRAYLFGRRMIWKEVGRQYLEVFEEAREERSRRPRPALNLRKGKLARDRIPELDLRFLRRLTDDAGIFQHAIHTVPDRRHGYCTDDNARALMVAVRSRRFMQEKPEDIDDLAAIYLSFLCYAWDREIRRFRNFMNYERQWNEDEPSEDSHGRALWGLGIAAAYTDDHGLMSVAARLFCEALPTTLEFTSPRAWAFSLVGAHAYLRKFGGDSEVRRVREQLALRLFDLLKGNAADDWFWFEDILAYANAKLSHALILSGRWLQRGDMVEMGLKTLDFLLQAQRSPEGHFSPVGHDGWYPKGGPKARFDQQPIEAHAMIEALAEAWGITNNERWRNEARVCFEWFLGRNDIQVPLCDSATGGCRDGLTPDSANENEGAESTLSWLLSVIAMLEIEAHQPVG